MQVVTFLQSGNERKIRLKLSRTAATYRLYLEWLVAIEDESITIDYYVNKSDFALFKSYNETVTDVLIQYNLHRRPESVYHQSSILFYVIEYHRLYIDLVRDKDRLNRVDNMLAFLKLVLPLKDWEREEVQVSLLVKNQSFKFEDQPILSQIVIDELIKVTLETIQNGYPDLWRIHFEDNKPLLKGYTSAESTLRNVAVAKITKQLILYLNKDSIALKNNRPMTGEVKLTSKQGNFIYDLLKGLEIYRPTKASGRTQDERAGKEEPYHALRKLLARYQ